MTRKNAAKNEARQRQAKGGSYQQNKAAALIARSSPWICTRCQKPIAYREGYVALRDPDDLGYPHAPPAPEPPKEGESRGNALVRRIFAKKHIEYVALHFDCETPNEQQANPYSIEVERAETAEDWMSWVHHLGEKTWMEKRDVRIMLTYWFSNRGDSLHQHGG